MIVCETPLREVQGQREALVEMLDRRPEMEEWVMGALAVLAWMEHGTPLPLEEARRL